MYPTIIYQELNRLHSIGGASTSLIFACLKLMEHEIMEREKVILVDKLLLLCFVPRFKILKTI